MAEKEQVVTEIEKVSRPATEVMEKAGEGIFEYVEWLEERQNLLQDELAAKPGAQSRGIFWIDLFGYARGADDLQHDVKGNITFRSDVDGLHAMQIAFNALRFIKGAYHMTPYMQARGVLVKNNGQEAAPEKQTEEKAMEQATEGRQRRRKRDPETAEPSEEKESKSPDAIGAEKWYPVKSMKVVMSQDETQKYIYAKIGRWTKHGKPAYLDSSGVPEDVVTMIEGGEWNVGDTSITGVELKEDFPDMQFALLSADEKVIVGFANKPPA
jgi:hypothetical protein